LKTLTPRQLLLLSIGIAEIASQVDDNYANSRPDSELEDLLVAFCLQWPNDRENAVAQARAYLTEHRTELEDMLREVGIRV